MRSTLILVLLAGCGSFDLGTSYALQGQSQATTERDIALCKEQAGTALFAQDVEAEKARRRGSFSACMTLKGYRVQPP